MNFLFGHAKAALGVVEINNTGVTGQSLPHKNDFEHARGPRNSAYAVNFDIRDIHTYNNINTIFIYIHTLL